MLPFHADDGNVYDYQHKDDFLAEIQSGFYNIRRKRKHKEVINYINLPCSFDIETTSYKTVNGEKVGFMYIWMFGISGISIYGRTWDEFLNLMSDIEKVFQLSHNYRLVCFVHNLAFEFQFMRKLFDWDEVFSINKRTPIYAVTSTGIEFRCSYLLTGVRLEKVGEDLVKYKCNKMVGDLDYNKVRHSSTKISKKELGYCINDIRVVMCKIQECIESESKGIASIPLTKTGYVRRDVKNAVKKDRQARELIHSLKLSQEEYEMLDNAFQGGFTHANVMYSDITLEDVVSYDFTSSYPTVMIAEKFPMGNGVKVQPDSYEKFMEYIRTCCCLFDIVMTNVKLKKDSGDAPISKSKCTVKGNCVVDNGRIRECDELMTTITEQDFMIYRKFYTFDYEIGTMYVYQKGYLPKPFIDKVLEYYVKKTTLKDVEGKEEDYMSSKSNLNSIYGMMVMAIVREILEYTDKWEDPRKPVVSEVLEQYNDSNSRFTWFPWGVWITAYARKNLFTGIYECGQSDYVYSDTDSMKILNATDHDDYIAEYNRQVTDKLEACLDHYNIDKAFICPKTVEGKDKPLGVWDFDGHYKKFKTLGAKKYMVQTDDDKIKTTIAGIGKDSGAKYLNRFKKPFDKFKNGMTIPKNKTKKLTHYYIDDVVDCEVVDYNGVKEFVHCPSGVYLEKASFTIGLSKEYTDLLAYMHKGYVTQSFK